ncbi:hypothetical protein PAL_GLEAN10013360 [Pteropus alecto]|uniref:Uncharacterized protein n=1 Tax=Pteropus alecto TaxID=9402 RepID=L5L3D1_PTEAL|nr:hypothetical protein PAL_GLEAN10013360 [Pteropus alecto]
MMIIDEIPEEVARSTPPKEDSKDKDNKKEEEKVEPYQPTIFPTSLVPLQSEEGEVVDAKPILLSAQENDPDLLSEGKLQSQQNEGACVMHQEYQVQPCGFSVSREPRPSSPAVTSLASPLHCISHFLSCVCQTFSRSRKQKPPIREGAKQAEAGGDAKAPRFGTLRCLGKNKVQPHETL